MSPVAQAAAPLNSGDFGRIYRRLLGYAKLYWGMFSIGVLGMLMFASTEWGLAWLVKTFLNEAFIERNMRVLWFVPAGIFVLFTLRSVGDYMSNYFPGWVGRQIIKAMRAELFAHYLNLPTSYYDRAASAQMLSRLTYNIELVAEAATNSVSVLIRDSLSIAGLLAWLFYLDWQLASFALALAPLIAWLMRRVNHLFRRYGERIQSSMSDVTRVAKEALDLHRLIKASNAQAHERETFAVVNERNRHSNMRLIATRSLSNPVVQVIAALGLAGVMYFAIRQVMAGRMQVGDVLSFLTAMLLITAPLRRLMSVFSPLQQGVAAGASVFEVLDLPLEADTGTREVERARGDVEFSGVQFSYEAGKGAALKGIDLKAPAGTTLAIVGKNGSGKSTLVSLLLRFHDPQQGTVRLDGVDIREYKLANLRRQIALVSQDIVLINDSIRNNILFGMANASPEAVEAAARATYVTEFAAELPEGLDTMVGDRGALLSGGQRQRVAIARALLKNAPVLVLDEAMSALDSHSERRVHAAVTELMRNRTTLVIAHRLSTVEQADRIVVMEDGMIVESGVHAGLLANGGPYAQLYRFQFSA